MFESIGEAIFYLIIYIVFPLLQMVITLSQTTWMIYFAILTSMCGLMYDSVMKLKNSDIIAVKRVKYATVCVCSLFVAILSIFLMIDSLTLCFLPLWVNCLFIVFVIPIIIIVLELINVLYRGEIK